MTVLPTPEARRDGMEKPQGHTVDYAEDAEWNRQSAKSVAGYVERDLVVLCFYLCSVDASFL